MHVLLLLTRKSSCINPPLYRQYWHCNCNCKNYKNSKGILMIEMTLKKKKALCIMGAHPRCAKALCRITSTHFALREPSFWLVDRIFSLNLCVCANTSKSVVQWCSTLHWWSVESWYTVGSASGWGSVGDFFSVLLSQLWCRLILVPLPLSWAKHTLRLLHTLEIPRPPFDKENAFWPVVWKHTDNA